MLANWLCYLLGLSAAVFLYFANPTWLAAFILMTTLGLPMVSCLWTLLFRFVKPAQVELREESQKIYALMHISEFLPGEGYADICIHDCVGDTNAQKKIRLSEEKAIDAKVPFGHYGCYELTLNDAFHYDLLGMFRFHLDNAHPNKVSVYPEPLEMEHMPDFTYFEKTGFSPKPGGGYAEVHEARPYREGDPLNSIHWKLSAKHDELIVREPMAPTDVDTMIAYDTPSSREDADRMLRQIFWLSNELLKRERPHRIGDCGIRVNDPFSQHKAMKWVMSRKMVASSKGGGWVCRIESGGGND